MCGISGWFLKSGNKFDVSHLEAMAGAIDHRGPDDRGYFVDNERGVAFAHNRLSIIDLSSAGHQPMISEDGNFVLDYNGEIYNFLQLRKELEGLGHQFISRTDSEVVLRSFMEWGAASVERFCGMFAFAVWSRKSGKLFLARDPLGMKPLYYAALPGGNGFVFASEIKAFLSLPNFSLKVNRTALRQFLEFGYTFDNHATSVQGVNKLPPGHCMEVVGGVANSPQAFFTPPIPDQQDRRTLQEREEELHETLSQVVAQHLVADVPVGLLL